MSQPEAPPAESVRRARVFWEQSRQDLKSARGQQRAGAYLDGRFFSLQAAVNALSAVCHLHGHFQLPNSSVLQLLALCREADPRFELLDLACAELEQAAQQNPFAQGIATGGEKAAGSAGLKQCEAVVKAVRGYLKDNRKRFFAP